MMTLHGTTVLQQPCDEIWPLIFDPHSLLGLIPGCQDLEFIPPADYQAEIRIGLAGVNGLYLARVKILHALPPTHCAFSGEVTGPTGVVSGSAAFNLEPVPAGTEINYDAQAIITGALAKLNPRFIEGVTNTLIKQGLAQLERQLLKLRAASSS